MSITSTGMRCGKSTTAGCYEEIPARDSYEREEAVGLELYHANLSQEVGAKSVQAGPAACVVEWWCSKWWEIHSGGFNI